MVAVVVELIVMVCRLFFPLIKLPVTEWISYDMGLSIYLLIFGQARSEQESGAV